MQLSCMFRLKLECNLANMKSKVTKIFEDHSPNIRETGNFMRVKVIHSNFTNLGNRLLRFLTIPNKKLN